MSYHAARGLGHYAGLGYTVDAWGVASNEPDNCPFTHVMRNGRCLTLQDIGFDPVAAEQIVNAYNPVKPIDPVKGVATGDRVAHVYGIVPADGLVNPGPGAGSFAGGSGTPRAAGGDSISPDRKVYSWSGGAAVPHDPVYAAAAAIVPSAGGAPAGGAPRTYTAPAAFHSAGSMLEALTSGETYGVPNWALWGGAAVAAVLLLGGGGGGRGR